MADREKVIEGLKKVWNAFDAMEHELYADYVFDALAMLKEQEQDRIEIAHEMISNSILMYQGKEIVRCKDCKHGQFEQWDNGECVDKTVYCDGYGIHKPDWFCADGQKRSE